MVQHNLVHWTPHGNGSVADIPEGKWLGIIKSATSNSTLIKDVEKAAKSIHRRGSESIGSVEGYAGTINCYGSGAVDPDANVVNSVTDACNALVGTSLPPLAKGSLRVWQTGQQADWHGEASYVRFSTKLLTDGFKYDITQCTQALNNFDTYCQDDSGWTRGGEITISGDIMCKCFCTCQIFSRPEAFELMKLTSSKSTRILRI